MKPGHHTYQVMRWDPVRNRFMPVGRQVSDIGLALQWAAEKRLLDSEYRFAVFDGDGHMVEDEGGRLLTNRPNTEHP